MNGDRFKGIPRNSPWRINEAIEKAMTHPQPAVPVRVRKPRRNVERDTVHIPVMEWIYAHEDQYPVLRLAFHCPNEGRRGYKGQQDVVAMGVRKGVPDLMLPLGEGYAVPGIAMEFKAPGEPPTPEQAEYLLALRKGGWHADVYNLAAYATICLETILCFGAVPQHRVDDHVLTRYARPRGFNDAF